METHKPPKQVCVCLWWASMSRTQTGEQTEACQSRSIQILDRNRPVNSSREHEVSVTGKSQHLHTSTHTHIHMKSGCSSHRAKSGKLTQAKNTIFAYILMRLSDHQHWDFFHLTYKCRVVLFGLLKEWSSSFKSKSCIVFCCCMNHLLHFGDDQI